MKEAQYQKKLVKHLSEKNPSRTYVPHVDLKYEIGKYYKGQQFGMPDTITDFIEFDEKKNFHLWELKLLESKELWSGKFFGQLMLYNFLFSTEPWSELVGRFCYAAKKPSFCGDINAILSHLAGFGAGEEAEEGDRNAVFKTWNLCVCGGKGYELAAGFNPVIWSYWVISDEYYAKKMPRLKIWHLFPTKSGLELRNMESLVIAKPSTLHPEALAAFKAQTRKRKRKK
jgi:hypothetical protein